MKKRKKRRQERYDLHIERVPPDVHRAFKAACANRGVPMREVVIDLMTSYAIKHPSYV